MFMHSFSTPFTGSGKSEVSQLQAETMLAGTCLSSTQGLLHARACVCVCGGDTHLGLCVCMVLSMLSSRSMDTCVCHSWAEFQGFDSMCHHIWSCVIPCRAFWLRGM